MQLNLEHITQKSLFWEQINTLAKEAFPPEEYLAPDELVKMAQADNLDFLALLDGDSFVGFMVVQTYEDLAYLFFLAIDAASHSKGYGSRAECDFSQGFYMGTATLQSLTLVCAENKPKFYTVEFDLSGLKVLEVKIDMDWAMMIAYYRKPMENAKGTTIYEKYAHFADGYDVIVGYIANDRIYTELARFFNGTITDVALLKCLSVLDLGKQYVAITQKACNQIKILKERDLHLLERLALQDKSVARRAEGIAMADEVVKQYRREGQFFDEILGGI